MNAAADLEIRMAAQAGYRVGDDARKFLRSSMAAGRGCLRLWPFGANRVSIGVFSITRWGWLPTLLCLPLPLALRWVYSVISGLRSVRPECVLFSPVCPEGVCRIARAPDGTVFISFTGRILTVDREGWELRIYNHPPETVRQLIELSLSGSPDESYDLVPHNENPVDFDPDAYNRSKPW